LAGNVFPGWLSWWSAEALGMILAVPLVIAVKHAARGAGRLGDTRPHYPTVVESCPDAVLIQQDDRFSFANRAAADLFGTADAEQLIGGSMRDFTGSERRDENTHRRAAPGGPAPRRQEKIRRLDGREIHVDIHAAPFMHRGRIATLLMLRDITALKGSAEELTYLAYHDALTGLPNRALFHQRLDHALRIAARPGRSLEILFLDLDRFKEINDTLGHAAGDLVLKETARRLQAILRESDTVARLGGDEFVVLAENVDEPQRGGTIAAKILAAMALPLEAGDYRLRISTSIGISHSPAHGTDADTLLKKADIAMYRAKQCGRNGYRYYSDEAAGA
jgi:diguanylate cyclase (GGDEF)-like protein/PAS domain S-box-containing protein